MRKNKWWLNGGRGSGRTFRLLWETYENKIADLEQKLEQTEKELADYQFNYQKIKELEKENANLRERLAFARAEFQRQYKENAELKKSVNNWLKYEKETQYHKSIIKDLKTEIAELKETLKTYNGCGDWDNDFHACRVYLQHEELQKYVDQLTKAKKLLKQFLEAKNNEDTYKAEWEAEQFIKEIEK